MKKLIPGIMLGVTIVCTLILLSCVPTAEATTRTCTAVHDELRKDLSFLDVQSFPDDGVIFFFVGKDIAYVVPGGPSDGKMETANFKKTGECYDVTNRLQMHVYERKNNATQ